MQAEQLSFLGEIELVNVATGERYATAQIREQPKPKTPTYYAYPSRAYSSLSDDALALLRFELSKLELEIFFRLILSHAGGAFRPVVVAALAAELRAWPSNVSEALSYLVRCGALIRDDAQKYGRSYGYMVNPILAFRGSSQEHQQVREDWDRPLPLHAPPRPVKRRRDHDGTARAGSGDRAGNKRSLKAAS